MNKKEVSLQIFLVLQSFLTNRAFEVFILTSQITAALNTTCLTDFCAAQHATDSGIGQSSILINIFMNSCQVSSQCCFILEALVANITGLAIVIHLVSE